VLNDTNIYDLAASITVKADQADKALDRQQTKVKALAEEYKKLDKATQNIGSSSGSKGDAGLRDLQNMFAKARAEVDDLKAKTAALSTENVASTASFLTMAGAVGGFTLALAANVVAVIAVHKAMLDLAISTGREQAEISNLARQYKVSSATIQAAQILAAQTGRSLSDVLKDQSDELDAARAKYEKLNIIMGTDAVAAGARLNNALIELTAQWSAMGNAAGSAITPQLLSILRDLQSILVTLGPAAQGAATGIAVLAAYLTTNLRVAIAVSMAALAPLISALQYIDSWKAKATPQKGGDGLKLLNEIGEAWRARNATLPIWGMGKAGRGGGGGGAVKIDAGIQLLERLQTEIARLTSHSKAQEMEEELLGKKYDKTRDAIKKKIIVLAQEYDIEKMILGITRQRSVAMAEYLKFVELVQQSLTRKRQVSDITGELYIDLGGGSVYGAGEGSTRPRTMATGATRPRIATAQEQVLRDQLAVFHERMRYLAGDLTNVLDNAIYTGIYEGMKKGLLSFTQGILQMIQSAALRALEDRLYKILSKTGQSSGDEEEDGGGGGGFFGILKGLLGGLLGSGGGGGGGGGNSGPVGSGIGNFASGGFMSPNSWNIVGERGPELIRSGNSGATVLPNTGGNTYINFYVQNGAQLGSRDTQAQIARQMTRIQQKRALAG
jgi:hypothetical protein